MTTSSNDTLTQDDIDKILSVVERSAFDSIEVSIGETRIFASKTPDLRPAPARARDVPVDSSETLNRPEEPQRYAHPSPHDGETAQPDLRQDEGPDPDTLFVRSPVVGTFYIAPEPGARLFVEIGQDVTEDMTVGLIEVMKTFIDVKAGCAGKIAKRLVENAEGVEFDQPLFAIEPTAA